jgi:hypothetical protein
VGIFGFFNFLILKQDHKPYMTSLGPSQWSIMAPLTQHPPVHKFRDEAVEALFG